MPPKSTSRVVNKQKLLRACAKIGIKTQVELVDKIIEKFPDASPAYTVGRMYRGNAVGQKTITMVTAALDVEYDALFDDFNGPEHVENQNITDNSNQRNNANSDSENNENDDNKQWRNKNLSIVGIFLMLVLVIAAWSFISYKTEVNINTHPKLTVGIAQPVIAVVGLETSKLENDFVEQLQANLGNNIKINSVDLTQMGKDPSNPFTLRETLNVDAVLAITSEVQGRYSAIFIHAYDKRQKTLLFAEVYNNATITSATLDIANKTSAILNNRINVNETNIELPSEEKSVSALLAGLNYLDEPTEKFFLNLAENNIYRSLSISPTYEKAKTALCYALTISAYSESNNIKKEEANKYCDALSDSQVSVYLKSIEAFRQRKAGNYKSAIQILRDAITLFPNSTDLMLGLTETYVNAFSETQDPAFVEKGVDLLMRAETIEPDFWKVSFVRSRLLYFTGKPKLAIEEVEKSVNIKANYANLSNLATMNFCFGDPKKSAESYERITLLNGAVPTAFYNLGSIQGYFQEYDKAARTTDIYLEKLAQIGATPPLEGYVGAASNYRLAGLVGRAKTMYNEALVILESIRLQEEETETSKITSIYVQISLDTLYEEILAQKSKNEYLEELDNFSKSVSTPNNILQLIFAYLLLDV